MAFPWALFGLIFLLPFVDPRRPLRILHLDMLMLAVVAAWPLRAFLAAAPPYKSIAVTVMVLAYLAARLLWTGLRPTQRPEPLVPLLPLRWLAVAVVLLALFRTGYVLLDETYVVDVGAASVAVADRVARGEGPYEGGLDDKAPHADTYGPAVYLAYVPFEQALPSSDAARPLFASPAAARAAAIAFDLLTLVALYLLGRRLRSGTEGRMLGVALSFAWVSYPYSLFVLRFSFNDALVALLVVACLLAITAPATRGVVAGLAAAAKFAPAVLVPLLAAGTGERRLRSTLSFGAAFAGVLLALFLPFIPDGGLQEIYERTVKLQAERSSLTTVWGRNPSLEWLQWASLAAVGALALATAVLPRRRTLVQVAALAAGLLAMLELTMTYWLPSYVVWFAPAAFAALFAVYDCRGRGARDPRLRVRSDPAPSGG